MSLVSIALVGKRGEPLYVQEFKPSRAEDDDPDTGGPSEYIDFFGLDDEGGYGDGPTSSSPPYDCSLRQQFVLHSALDRFDELTAPGVRRAPPAAGAPASDAMWLGFLCPVDELRVYGYFTTTKIKILAAVEDSFLPDEAHRQKAREVDVKNLFANVHALYVEHALNPFAAAGSETRIDSRRFHDGVRRLAEAFNSSGLAEV